VSDDLELALRSLGRDLRVGEPAAGLAEAVLERVSAVRVPRPTLVARLRSRVALVLSVLVALVLTTFVVTPVGAHVADWFGFHGVMVREGEPHGSPASPDLSGRLSLADAAELVGFEPALPALLGAPTTVSVSADRQVVTMTWTRSGETVRLDQFDAGIEGLFWKTARGAERVGVAGGDALWFAAPHDVVLALDGGQPEIAAPRLAGPTLVWPRGRLTLRLEGVAALDRAVEIAESIG